jgi:hypothetical protein
VVNLELVRAMVRPVVTYVFSLSLVAGFFAGRITADQFLPLASAAVFFWFGDRAATKADRGRSG